MTPPEVLSAGDALYRYAVKVRMHHDAFMWAWRDKFDPKSLKELDDLRDELFATCEAWRLATGREAKDIAFEVCGTLHASRLRRASRLAVRIWRQFRAKR